MPTMILLLLKTYLIWLVSESKTTLTIDSLVTSTTSPETVLPKNLSTISFEPISDIFLLIL